MDKKPTKSPFSVRSSADLPHDTTVKQPPMRFSEADLLLLKKIFGGDEKLHLVKLLRKLFLPEYDPQAPLEQNIDLWMTIPLQNLTLEEAYIRLIARNEVIMHIEQRLNQISLLANHIEETEQQRDERLRKDSTR
jgi:hypothetical protein